MASTDGGFLPRERCGLALVVVRSPLVDRWACIIEGFGRHDKITFDEIASGKYDGCLWVSLGFVSEDHPHDVLYVVVASHATEDDRKLHQDTIYLERYDQSMSCYGGTSKIKVEKDFVKVYLTPTGKQQLGLRLSLHFVGLTKMQGHAEAKQIFREMSATECGARVAVTDDA